METTITYRPLEEWSHGELIHLENELRSSWSVAEIDFDDLRRGDEEDGYGAAPDYGDWLEYHKTTIDRILTEAGFRKIPLSGTMPYARKGWRRGISMIGVLEAVEPRSHGKRPFDKWEIHELVHFEDDLLETYGLDFSDGGYRNLGQWVTETLDEIAGLLDACGIPRLGEYGRAISIYPGVSPRDMISDDRVDAERVRAALEAFATAVGRADG